MRKKNSSVLQFAPGEVKAYIRKKTRGGTALFRCEKDSPLTRTLQRTFSRGFGEYVTERGQILRVVYQ